MVEEVLMGAVLSDGRGHTVYLSVCLTGPEVSCPCPH